MRLLFIFFLCLISIAESAIEQNVEWMEERSMLYIADQLAKDYSGKCAQWRYPYSYSNPRKVCEIAPNWLVSYSPSILTKPGQTVLECLGSEELWDALAEIGIDGIHTGPMKTAGSLQHGEHYATEDGGFDRIGLCIDPEYGTQGQYKHLVEVANRHRAVVIGDLIPGHTGRGPDFILAVKNYKNYPGIYHMIEIPAEDWHLLPQVPRGQMSVNLAFREVDALYRKGYIVGRLERVPFAMPGIKQTNWDATPIVQGVDGVQRRWIYLHYFKSNQPTLNWLDPSYAANRVLAGDAIQSIGILGDKFLRLDANSFLGAEKISNNKTAFSKGHPLSIQASNDLAMMIRKLGGFSFQELNLSLEVIKAGSIYGPDLSYDFLTRIGAMHAMITQNADFLRTIYELILNYDMQPMQFVHALQNYDEFSYELNHFRDFPDETYVIKNERFTGEQIRQEIYKEDTFILLNRDISYVLPSDNGPCSTLLGIIAAALRIPDIYSMNEADEELLKRAHILLTFFFTMQPGVFALSGWDLVGALPLPSKSIEEFLSDGDNRWVGRGAYDLMGTSCAKKTAFGLPEAATLYGPLPKQLKNKNSYASILKQMLKIRKVYNLPIAKLICVPSVNHPEVFFLVHCLPVTGSMQLTAINFGDKPVEEVIEMDELRETTAIDLWNRKSLQKTFQSRRFTVKLNALEGRCIEFAPRPSKRACK